MFKELRKHKALFSWVSHTRPDKVCCSNEMAQITNQTYTKESIRDMKAEIIILKNSLNTCLTYRQQDNDTAPVWCYADASFATNDDLMSQIGCLIMLCDDSEACHVFDFQSRKLKRVVTLAVVTETYAFVEAFDVTYLTIKDLSMTHEVAFKLYMYTDSLQLFNALTRGKRAERRRLMIDILAVRQIYKRLEIAGVGQIWGNNNPADGLTKLKHNKVLEKASQSRRMVRQAKKWIYRGELNNHVTNATKVRV